MLDTPAIHALPFFESKQEETEPGTQTEMGDAPSYAVALDSWCRIHLAG